MVLCLKMVGLILLFLTDIWLLLALVHNLLVGKIFAEVPVSNWIYLAGGEGLSEFYPNQTLLPPASPLQADRKKYILVIRLKRFAFIF